ncbi:HNH endonuclease [Candidatus Woesearchaeota archaeon]|nr:HNH endonuclease [Candidatus Woesearchaeota archaeon]
MKKDKSVSELIVEYFKSHPKQDLTHGPVVDWVEEKYIELYKKKPRDTWRAIRKLHEEGFLIKVKKGVYRYDPDLVQKRKIEEFTEQQKKKILERDDYKCVRCGRGPKEGVELQVDHIDPKYLGGKAILENGQTLCSQHNFVKKHLNQTETGKKMFIRLYELAKKKDNKEILNFCKEVLEVYDKHHINNHIIWKE